MFSTAPLRTLNSDEILTVRSVSLPFVEMLEERAQCGHSPVYFSLMWVWTKVVGDGELALRVPGIVSAALSAAVLRIVAVWHQVPSVAPIRQLVFPLLAFTLAVWGCRKTRGSDLRWLLLDVAMHISPRGTLVSLVRADSAASPRRPTLKKERPIKWQKLHGQ